MKTRVWFLLALYALLGSRMQAASQKPPGINTFPTEARQALQEALSGLSGETIGGALHAMILTRHGEVQPYSQILKDEVRDIEVLQKLCKKYQVPLRKASALKTSKPPGLRESALLGIEFARKNIALYERLLPAVSNYPDITDTFRQLQIQKRESHLPLLKAAAANGGTLPRRPLPLQRKQSLLYLPTRKRLRTPIPSQPGAGVDRTAASTHHAASRRALGRHTHARNDPLWKEA